MTEEVFGREELNRPIDSERLQDLFSKKEQRMTKEELKKEAEESAKKFFGKPTDLVDLDNLRIFKNGYLAGAEPREKRIEELEDTEIVNKAFKQQIKVLKKENAELKELHIAISEDKDMAKESYHRALKRSIETEKQLIKATEIIKEFARLEYADFTNGDYSNELSKVLEQAEQFLKEIE